MVTKLNTCSGVASGTTVSVSNSAAGGNALDEIDGIGGGGTVAYTNAVTYHSTTAIKLQTAGGAGSLASFLWKGSIGTVTGKYYGEIYLNIPAYPPAIERLISYNKSTSNCGTLHLDTTGQLVFRDSTGHAVLTSTSVVPLNTWVRIECWLIGDAAVGQMSYSYFLDPASTTPTETATSAATQATTGAPDSIVYGVSVTRTSIGPWYVQFAGASTDGPLGPQVSIASGALHLKKMTTAISSSEKNVVTGSIHLKKMTAAISISSSEKNVVTFDAAASQDASASTWTHVNSDASNAILVACRLGALAEARVSAIDYGGVSLAELGRQVSFGDGNPLGGDGVIVFGKIGGLPTGSNTVSVTGYNQWGGSCTYAGAGSFGDVFTSINTDGGGDSEGEVTISDTELGGICFVATSFGNAGGDIAAGTDAILRWQERIDSGSGSGAGWVIDRPSEALSTDVGWSNGNADWFGNVGVEIKPASDVEGISVSGTISLKKMSIAGSFDIFNGEQSLFKQGDIGLDSVSDDVTPYTLAVEFVLSEDASLTSIWFFSGSGAIALPIACGIFDVASKTLVDGTANLDPTWSDAPGAGWVRQAYDGSVTLSAGVRYKAAVLKSSAQYVYSSSLFFWSTGLGESGITNGIISAADDGHVDIGQDSFAPNVDVLTYPTNAFDASNYGVDVGVTQASLVSHVITGAISMKKMSVQGSGQEKTVITGAISMKKMSVQGSGQEKTVITGAISMKKMSVQGSGQEKTVMTGSIGMKKMVIQGRSIRQTDDALFIFSPL